MNIEELKSLLQAVADTGIQSFKYEENGVKISIQGKCSQPAQPMQMVQPMQMAQPMPMMQPVQMNMPMQDGQPMQAVQPEQMAQAVQPMQAAEGTADDGTEEILSPLVGIFYAAPAEDAAAFVKAGDTVQKGQTLAIVEAMKLMNEIEAEEDCVITEVLVKNAQAVEFGQPLFRMRKV